MRVSNPLALVRNIEPWLRAISCVPMLFWLFLTSGGVLGGFLFAARAGEQVPAAIAVLIGLIGVVAIGLAGLAIAGANRASADRRSAAGVGPIGPRTAGRKTRVEIRVRTYALIDGSSNPVGVKANDCPLASRHR